jgi:hypothetical protein
MEESEETIADFWKPQESKSGNRHIAAKGKIFFIK